MKLLAASALVFGLACTAMAQNHWVDTWTAAQQMPRVVAQTAAPNATAASSFSNQTVRMIVHSTVGGRRARVELSNTYGTEPLVIGGVHLAVRAKDSSIVPGSDRALTVNAKSAFSIPPGALMVTDPVDFEVPRFADLAVSIYVPGTATMQTQHSLGLHTTWISNQGNFSAQPEFAEARTSQSWYWLSSVQVLAPSATETIVAFGDSITEGFRSTPETNHMWPAILAPRLPQNLAIVNEAISGNQVLHDGAGVNALARFDRDVLSRPGVKWLVTMEGINDIGRGMGPSANAASAVTADEVIAGLQQMLERAHTQGIKVIGATLTPFQGAAYYSEKGEAARGAVNAWIRSGGVYDGVIDFDAVTRNPENPLQFRPEFDSGDHLHPNDAGYKAMADSIDISMFKNR